MPRLFIEGKQCFLTGVARTRIELVLPPWEGGVSSFGENVDAPLSNSVVAKDKQAAFVSLVIQYYFNSNIFLVLMYLPACIW